MGFIHFILNLIDLLDHYERTMNPHIQFRMIFGNVKPIRRLF